MFDIIVVGSNTVDAFVKTDAELVHHRCKGKQKLKGESNPVYLTYPVGEKILIKHLEFQVGGGGTNTSIAFARLGLDTGYLGKIGDDENGVKVFRLLKNEKVNFIGSIGKTTGFSVVLDSMMADRTILAHKGCNDDLSFYEINSDHLETKWFHLCSMVGKSFVTLKHIAKFAVANNIKVAFNPSSYLVKKGMKEIKPILDTCNILILNREEACILTEMNGINKLLKNLKKLVKDYVVITNGKKGAYCYDGKFKYSAKPKKNLKIVETTGAGDAFAAGFISGVMMEKNVKKAMRMGFIEAENVIQAYGPKNDLLTLKKMNAKLNKDKRRIEIKKV